MKFIKFLLVFTVAAFSLSAFADNEDEKILTKEEVEVQVSGKILNGEMRRSKVRLQFDSNGYMFLNASGQMGSVSDSGKWSIEENGKLCMKLRYFGDSCSTVSTKSGKLIFRVEGFPRPFFVQE